MRTGTDMVDRGSARCAAHAVATILLAGIAVLLSGCGTHGDTAEGTSTEPTTASAAPADRPAPTPLPTDDSVVPVGDTWLSTADAGELGTIVVDDAGRTLYAFDKDTPRSSACYDACADTWMPALTSGDPTGGIGTDASQIASIGRRDGQQQVAYYGHPLYYYDGDSGPGQTNGQGLEVFGGRWSVVNPDGEAVG